MAPDIRCVAAHSVVGNACRQGKLGTLIGIPVAENRLLHNRKHVLDWRTPGIPSFCETSRACWASWGRSVKTWWFTVWFSRDVLSMLVAGDLMGHIQYSFWSGIRGDWEVSHVSQKLRRATHTKCWLHPSGRETSVHFASWRGSAVAALNRDTRGGSIACVKVQMRAWIISFSLWSADFNAQGYLRILALSAGSNDVKVSD